MNARWDTSRTEAFSDGVFAIAITLLVLELIKPEVSDQEITAVTLAATPNTAVFLGAIVLAIIVPKVAAFGYLVFAVVAVLRVRAPGTDTEPAAAAS